MNKDEFIQAVFSAGWRDSLDSQREHIGRLWEELFPDEALAESYKGEDIRLIRARYPKETCRYLDSEIAKAYAAYCQENFAAGWLSSHSFDLDDFIIWAFKGAIHRYTNNREGKDD